MAFWSTRHWQHKLILGSNLFKLQICSQRCWGIYVQTIVHWETKHHPRHPRVMLNDVGVCFFSRKRSSKPCARFGVSWLKRPLKTRATACRARTKIQPALPYGDTYSLQPLVPCGFYRFSPGETSSASCLGPHLAWKGKNQGVGAFGKQPVTYT